MPHVKSRKTPYDERGQVGTQRVSSKSSNPGDVTGVTTDVGPVAKPMNPMKKGHEPRSESKPAVRKPADTGGGQFRE